MGRRHYGDDAPMKSLLPALVLMAGSAQAQTFDILPAPPGDSRTIAATVIGEKRDSSECGVIRAAERAGDGTILAICENGAVFRIFVIAALGPQAFQCNGGEVC